MNNNNDIKNKKRNQDLGKEGLLELKSLNSILIKII